MGIIKFAVKSCLAGGLVYYTVQEGLWSHADDSINFYNKIYAGVAPYITANIPNELPGLPNAGKMSRCAGAMWNNGVKTSMKFISELPTHVSNGIQSIKGSIENLNEQPKPKSDKPE